MKIRKITNYFLLTVALLLFFGVFNKAYASPDSETESNNTSATANVIDVNSSITANLSSKDDEDWFYFETEVNGYFNIDFTHEIVDESETCWRLYLYDSSAVNGIAGSTGYYGIVGNTSGRTTCNHGVEAGKYYLKVIKHQLTMGYNYYNVDYNLAVNFFSSSDWETENNNSKDTADYIDLTGSINASLSNSNDEDWFEFEIAEKGYFDITFNHTVIDESETCWRLYLYDSTGINGIEGSTGYYGITGNKSSKTTNKYGVEAGKYYLKVIKHQLTMGYNFSNVDYNLTINFYPVSNWETENNNNKEKADVIELYKGINASLTMSDDIDWFALNISNSREIQITLNHEIIDDSNSFWTIYLYDSTGVTELLKFSRKGSTASASTDFVSVNSGVYYIKITKYFSSMNSKYSPIPYTLFVTERHEHIGTWVSKIDPTCTESGVEERTCTLCGTKEERETNPLGHDYSNGTDVIKEATCTESGSKACTCSRCGHKETIEIPALGHDYELTKDSESTIMKQGEKVYTCSRCGDSYVKKDKSKVWIFPTIISIELIVFAAFLIIKKAYRQ